MDEQTRGLKVMLDYIEKRVCELEVRLFGGLRPNMCYETEPAGVKVIDRLKEMTDQVRDIEVRLKDILGVVDVVAFHLDIEKQETKPGE